MPYNDDNSIVDNILDVTITLTSLGLSPQDIDIDIDTLLKCLRRANTPDGNPIQDMDSGIAITDYTSLLKKQKNPLAPPSPSFIWATT